ncbi:MAG: DUF2851 family protein [Fulvivirga sp.]
MTEAFLHYIWKHQYFDKKNLKTTQGEPLTIFNPGFHNTDAGPDFKEAKISIAGIEWRGQVEIHINASDWQKHKHQLDKAYNSTVLHVVLKEDDHVKRQDNTSIPTLELDNRIYLTMIQQYDQLLETSGSIPCDALLAEIDDLTKISMIDKAVMQRLERKSLRIQEFLKGTNNNWEETTYQLLAENFGFKINAEPFLKLARSLPLKVIKKHADQVEQVEALLFGQSGFLDEKKGDDYQTKLNKEYKFLRSKYSLQPISLHEWKFLRLRPANFPTLRIAQLASILSDASSLFASFIQESPKAIIELLRRETSTYWQNHYQFGEPTSNKLKGLGKSSAILVCINTLVPLLIAYSKHIDDQKYTDKAIDLLQFLPAEKNKITRIMDQSGFIQNNAFDTQGAIELHNNFCSKSRCLECNIGAKLVRPA